MIVKWVKLDTGPFAVGAESWKEIPHCLPKEASYPGKNICVIMQMIVWGLRV
jgi:hypothetical protein